MTLLRKAPLLEDFPHILVETLRFADTDRNGHITSSVFALLPEWTTDPAVQSRTRHSPGTITVCVGQPPARLPERAALARDSEGRHPRRAGRPVLRHAGAGAVPNGPMCRDRAVRCSAHGCDNSAFSADTTDVGRRAPDLRRECQRRAWRTRSRPRTNSASSRSRPDGSSSALRASGEVASAINALRGVLTSVRTPLSA